MKWHRNMISSIALLAVSIVFPAGARADLTYQDFAFESPPYSLGNLGGQGDTYVWSAGAGYQVVANTIGWTVAGSQTLKITDTAGWGEKFLSWSTRPGAGVWYTDFYLLPTDTTQDARVWVTGGASGNVSGFGLESGGSISVNGVATAESYVAGQTIRVTQEMDFTTDTMNIYLNGNPTPWKTGVALMSAVDGGGETGHPVNGLALFCSGTGITYFDGYRLTDVKPALTNVPPTPPKVAVTNMNFTFEPTAYSLGNLAGQKQVGDEYAWLASAGYQVVANDIVWAGAGTQTLKITDTAGWGEKYLSWSKRPGTGTGVWYFVFSLLPTGSAQDVRLWLTGGGGNVTVFALEGGNFYYNNVNSGESYTPGQTIRVTEKLDFETDTFSIYLNENPVAWKTDVALMSAVSEASPVSGINFYTAGTGITYADNIVFTDGAPDFLAPPAPPPDGTVILIQ